MAEPPPKRRRGSDHLDAIATQIDDLERQNRELDQKLAALQAENGILRTENNFCKDRNSAIKKEKVALENEATVLKELIKALDVNEKTRAVEIKELKSKIARLEQQAGLHETAAKADKKKAKDQEKQIKSSDTRLGEMERITKKLEQDLAEAKTVSSKEGLKEENEATPKKKGEPDDEERRLRGYIKELKAIQDEGFTKGLGAYLLTPKLAAVVDKITALLKGTKLSAKSNDPETTEPAKKAPGFVEVDMGQIEKLNAHGRGSLGWAGWPSGKPHHNAPHPLAMDHIEVEWMAVYYSRRDGEINQHCYDGHGRWPRCITYLV